MLSIEQIVSRPPTPSAIRRRMQAGALAETREAIAKEGQLKLTSFIKLAWHAVEPARQYVHGWHVDAIAEHLTAITSGQLIRLLITIPPGMMKSLLSAVFWPAWEWGPAGRPSIRFIGFSYEQQLSTRDALRCRRLMQSDWYRTLWGDQFNFVDDQNVKTRYENDKTGYRISDYVGGGTGDRGDRDIVDDPHNVKDGESDAMRLRAQLWLSETLPSRLNDPDRSAIVVIHHRIHSGDMAGEIIARDLGYEHLMLPMEFEVARRCKTSIGFKDPRTKEGELLFPARFPKEVVERDKHAMGSYACAGQFQQRPAPRGGGIIKRDWFEIVGPPPADCYWVRYWDLAASEEAGSAYTSGVLIGCSRSTKMFYVKDVKRQRLAGDGGKRLILQSNADGAQWNELQERQQAGFCRSPGGCQEQTNARSEGSDHCCRQQSWHEQSRVRWRYWLCYARRHQAPDIIDGRSRQDF